MKTHEEKLQKDVVALTAEKIDQVSGNIYLFLKKIWDTQDVFEHVLKDSRSEAYRSAKIVLAAHNLLEALREELDTIAEKVDGISKEDLLRTQHILNLIDDVASKYIVSEAENAYRNIPDWMEDYKEYAMELLRESYKFLGYLESLRYDNIIVFDIGELPDDLKATYDSFINKLYSYDDDEEYDEEEDSYEDEDEYDDEEGVE